MRFLSHEAFNEKEQSNNNNIRKLDGAYEQSLEMENTAFDNADQEIGCYQAVHAQYAPSRRLRHMFFEEHILVNHMRFLSCKNFY